MKQNIFFILFFSTFLLTVSCANNEPTHPEGTFYGILPCADCPGIHYEITFQNDSAYIEKMVYQEKNNNFFSQQGTYTVNKNKIIKLKGKTPPGMDQFLFKNDTLVMLDISGQKIEGVLAGNYILTKEKPAGFSLTANKTNENFDFKATGNEPFWSLKIDFEKKMVFTSIDTNVFDITTPVPEPVRPQDVDAVNYSATAESGTLQVTIFRQKCTDSMSGRQYGYKVRVNAKTGKMDDFVSFSGCGKYLGNYRIDNIWELKSMNGENIDKDIKAPHLEFSLAENRFSGFGGCNRIFGNIEYTENELTFNNIASTKMACPGLTIEDRFLDYLGNNGFEFEIDDNALTLKNDSVVLKFESN